MCGIFGVISPTESRDSVLSVNIFKELMLKSESRGKDASGLALFKDDEILIFKSRSRGRKLLKSPLVTEELARLPRKRHSSQSAMLIGHTRMITHGDVSMSDNNQPCLSYGRFIVFHNGIIVNWREIGKQFDSIEIEGLSDTQIFCKLLEKNMKFGMSPTQSLKNSLNQIEGANNFVVIDTIDGNVNLFSSNGSLFVGYSSKFGHFLFGSERKIIERSGGSKIRNKVTQIPVGELINLEEMINDLRTDLNFNYSVGKLLPIKNISDPLHEIERESRESDLSSLKDFDMLNSSINYELIGELRRCTLCILPESFPKLTFNDQGICQLCSDHTQKELFGREKLKERLTSTNRSVLVPISGGRDSMFALHYVVKELNIPAVTYTYDWGFVSNSARENISKICGKLKVENILVAADIAKKRKNVRNNLRAWLDKPSVGMIPLLMAGDKQFLTFAETIRKENALTHSIFAMNQFEKTLFKSAYAGTNYKADARRFHGVSRLNRVKILFFYITNFLKNPKYLNSSLIDSAVGYLSFYLVHPNYIQIYDYIEWEEDKISEVLEREYSFNKSHESQNAWRSGDATSGFYNYLYLRFGGFTENDTFRSNQIRCGQITREVAMQRIALENQVQADMIVEYLKTLDFSVIDFYAKVKDWGRFGK